MSKILNQLYQAQAERDKPKASRSAFPLILLVFGILFSINAVFFFVLSYSSARTDATLAKLNNIQSVLDKNARALTSLSADVKKLASDTLAISQTVKAQDKKIQFLAEGNDAHTVAIENLIKAKNTLFNRVNTLDNRVITVTPAQ